MTALLEVTDLVKHFPIHRGMGGAKAVVHALDGVSLRIDAGEMVALVGESGSGKTTLARCILGLTAPTAGRIVLDGTDVTTARGKDLRAFRRRVQPVFQDPYASLDPRWSAARTIREPLDAYGIGTPAERDQRVNDLLDRVGLGARMGARRPHELSGGQRQRVGIAAALALGPDLIVADEPVSALDVSVQAQILNLLADLHRDLGIAIVLITHNLAVVEHVCDRAVVLYLGHVVEEGPVSELFRDPEHPYTQGLMASIPYPDPARRLAVAPIRGEVPSPIDPPRGCRFHPRCPAAIDVCRAVQPDLTAFGPGHRAACHVARLRQDAGQPPIDTIDHHVQPVASEEPMPRITVNGIEIDYLIEGDGLETVVMVNGLADEKESWGYQTPDLLAAGYRVLTFDNRGVGRSSKPAGPYTTAQFAADTKALVDALGITGFHLVGTSMGGMICQEYAIAYGSDLKSVTLSSTYAAPGPFCSRMFSMWADMAPVLGVPFVMRDVTLWAFTLPFFETREAELQEFEAAMAGMTQPLEAYLAQLSSIQTHDTVSRLGAITTPTLVIAGEEDILIPVALSRRLHEGIAGSEWVTTPGGHASIWEHPEPFNQAVLTFIARHH